MPELAEWDSFYVILGSAAGALIGLQFVVMTLIAERPPPRASEAGAAFATPTIVHFSVVLLLSALLRAPWHSVEVPAMLVGLLGAAGMIYAAFVARRMRVQTSYEPEIEDWLFYLVVPLIGYVVLGASAVTLLSRTREAWFGIGGATLVLLFTGIHNAWDSVSYHVLVSRPPKP